MDREQDITFSFCIYQHAAAVVGERLYISGGSRNGRHLSDIQVLSCFYFVIAFMFRKSFLLCSLFSPFGKWALTFIVLKM